MNNAFIVRFASTAPTPQMVHAGWFGGEQAAYLGVANLLGYLIGAVAAAPLPMRLRRWPSPCRCSGRASSALRHRPLWSGRLRPAWPPLAQTV